MWENFNAKVSFGTTTFLLSLVEKSKRSLLSMNEEKRNMRDVLETVLEWAKVVLYV